MVSNITIIPASITPANIARKAFLDLKPKTNAAAQPVQAPVAGNGMPTNMARPIGPYFSNWALCL